MALGTCNLAASRGTGPLGLTLAVASVALATCTAEAGFVLESRATFVHLRHVHDGTPVFFTENPARGFRAFASDGHPLDPVIPLSDLPFYNFTMTSTQATEVRPGHCEYTGEYEIRFGSFGTLVPPSIVSAGTFSIALTFVDLDDAMVTGRLTQQSGAENGEFPDLSCGGLPIFVDGTYQHTYHLDGTWSGGGTLLVDFHQPVVPAPGAIAVLGLAAMTARRRR